MVSCRKSCKLENLSTKQLFLAALQIVIASCLLAILSVFKIPLYPTPMTLQTFAVFIIPLILGPYKGSMAVGLYLLEASCGWPILSGGSSNALWILTPNFGFLLSFPLAAYVIGIIYRHFYSKNFFKTFFAVLCGQCIICCAGVSGLSCFFGWEKAYAYGVTPFMLAMLVKMLAAAACFHGMLSFKYVLKRKV